MVKQLIHWVKDNKTNKYEKENNYLHQKNSDTSF